MTRSLSAGEADQLRFFHHRNRLLTAIREHSLCEPEEQSRLFIFQQCCAVLKDVVGCDSVWAGGIDRERHHYVPFASFPPVTSIDAIIQKSITETINARFGLDPVAFTAPISLSPGEPGSIRDISAGNSLVWPVGYQGRFYGFVTLHQQGGLVLNQQKKECIGHIIDDIALAIFALDTAQKLKIERDFNKEIVDTIQALMVTISPCGTILSFNRRAEQVSGYSEREIQGKYWVDVLISPDRRLECQQVFSDTLKGTQPSINFQAPLLTRAGTVRAINWHGSIRHNIEQGTVGLVMLGIDETESLAADQQLNMLTARWEKIFIAIQDPALVVSNDSTIIEANPATCAAAKKRREEVIGKKVCDILHLGHGEGTQCPLEQFIGCRRTQITETELHGLHGTYMLTVSPLVEENGDINATLLLARNLTEEEVVRAEAIRAAQLAAIGELASGVAHEINNPINGIINYAQLILDDPGDPETTDNLYNIISEGKRIAGIVSNLLAFARHREEALALSRIETIIANSLHLVAHLLKKDGIVCAVNIADPLPPLMCNEQQLQQVVLNLISNARYALNMRYPQPCPEKRLIIGGEVNAQGGRQFLRLSFTDYGIGIAPGIQERIFDPFFSTKPKGEGTGLGLSISHGLVRDHGGFIRVRSKVGEWTQFQIDLPVHPDGETT